jgi:predicted acylesterase/phospholipase RssA
MLSTPQAKYLQMRVTTQATFFSPRAVLLACIVSLITLQGCAPVVVTAPSRPPADVAADSPGGIRILGADHRFAAVSVQSVVRRARTLRGGEPISILALSGDGADGAFGAGALVGLTNAGARPQFSVVTGVSAGALLAPYAFLGSEWDKQLTDAYASGRAEHLLQSRGPRGIFDSRVSRGRALEKLVDHYLSDELIQAVARKAASGRLLLVATTNVDTGETVIWDLGSIAMNGGPSARALFRDVLVASASVPGMFPPVVIRVQDAGEDYSEAHVDGAATVPFLVPPTLLQLPRDVTNGSPTTVYVLVDGRLTQEPVPIRLRLRAVLSRSISVGMTHKMRTTLELTATTAQLQGASLQYSAIPAAYPNLASFDFRASTMRSLFEYGHDCAYAGRLWISSQSAVADQADRGETVPGKRVECPADDDFIGGVAVGVPAVHPGRPAVSLR